MSHPVTSPRCCDWVEAAALIDSLRSRQEEVADCIYSHLLDVATGPMDGDPEYRQQLRATVRGMVSYCFDILRTSPRQVPPPPDIAVAQASDAARAGISLGTVLGRYIAGHVKLGAIIVDEARLLQLPDLSNTLLQLRDIQERVLEYVSLTISEAYDCARHAGLSPDERCEAIVMQLLAQEPGTENLLAQFDYDFDAARHLGLVIQAPPADDLQNLHGALSRHFGKRLLWLPRTEGAAWAWLSGSLGLSIAELAQVLSGLNPLNGAIAVGEAAPELAGWRQTHIEAAIASRVAPMRLGQITTCTEVLPVVAVLQSDAITNVYQRKFLLPLNDLQQEGRLARRVLRAYLTHDRNVSSAAATLKVSRSTVEHHINEVRRVLGDHLNLTALEVALQLESLTAGGGQSRGQASPSRSTRPAKQPARS